MDGEKRRELKANFKLHVDSFLMDLKCERKEDMVSKIKTAKNGVLFSHDKRIRISITRDSGHLIAEKLDQISSQMAEPALKIYICYHAGCSGYMVGHETCISNETTNEGSSDMEIVSLDETGNNSCSNSSGKSSTHSMRKRSYISGQSASKRGSAAITSKPRQSVSQKPGTLRMRRHSTSSRGSASSSSMSLRTSSRESGSDESNTRDKLSFKNIKMRLFEEAGILLPSMSSQHNKDLLFKATTCANGKELVAGSFKLKVVNGTELHIKTNSSNNKLRYFCTATGCLEEGFTTETGVRPFCSEHKKTTNGAETRNMVYAAMEKLRGLVGDSGYMPDMKIPTTVWTKMLKYVLGRKNGIWKYPTKSFCKLEFEVNEFRFVYRRNDSSKSRLNYMCPVKGCLGKSEARMKKFLKNANLKCKRCKDNNIPFRNYITDKSF